VPAVEDTPARPFERPSGPSDASLTSSAKAARTDQYWVLNPEPDQTWTLRLP